MNSSFFFGANTPYGFKGFLNELYDTQRDEVILIKGSPGCGKNTIMEKVLENMNLRGIDCEEIHCSSDPDSLDGVIVPSLHKSIFDATAPHIMEPRYWGACETVADLSSLLKREHLRKNKRKLMELLSSCSEEHRKCCEELSKAKFVIEEFSFENEDRINKKAVVSAAFEIASEYFADSDGTFSQTHRFLSAVTPKGIYFLRDTLCDLCDKTILLWDPHKLFSELFMKTLAELAQEKSIKTIVCPCSVLPSCTDHMIFPDIKLCVSVSNEYLLHSREPDYSYKDFLLSEIPAPCVKPDGFLKLAAEHSKTAKNIHDEIELIYREAMNFSGADKILRDILGFFSE